MHNLRLGAPGNSIIAEVSLREVESGREIDILLLPEDRLFLPWDFLKQILPEIKAARQRVYLQSMTFEADHANLLVEEQLIGLKKERPEVDVRMNVDNYVNLVTASIPNIFLGLVGDKDGWRSHLKEQNQKMLERLMDSEIQLEVTNVSKIAELVFAFGRDHRKMLIVDDVLYFGGINFSQQIFERTDFVISMTDPRIVETAAQLFDQVNDRRPKTDMEYPCTEECSFLLDAGLGTSVILDRAIDLIEGAQESVDIMKPLKPNGIFLEAINKAKKRGVKVRLYQGEISDIGSLTKKDHAKLLIADRKSAIIGSHNFDPILVALRLTELSLLTTKPNLVRMLGNYFDHTIEMSAEHNLVA